MENPSSLFQKDHIGELVLVILFIIYLIMGYNTPEQIAYFIDTLIGKILIFIIVIYLFIHSNPILAVLSLFVAFELLRKSSMTTGVDALNRFAPSEIKRSSQFTAFNQFPYTLEQEVITKMAPIMQAGSTLSQASYKPVLENLYDASPVNAQN